MKKLLLFAVFVLMFVSCSSDDRLPESEMLPSYTAGTLTVNGSTTSIHKGYIVPPNSSSPDYDARRFYIILTDGDISMVGNELVYGDNVHQLIDFNLYTAAANAGAVQNTTYNLFIPESGSDFELPIIDHTSISTNVVVENGVFMSGDQLSSDDMDSGQITISAFNIDEYSISFSFSNGSNTISGQFIGTLSALNNPN